MTNLNLEDLFIRPILDENKVIVTFTCPADYDSAEYKIYCDDNEVVSDGVVELDRGTLRCAFESSIGNSREWSVIGNRSQL